MGYGKHIGWVIAAVLCATTYAQDMVVVVGMTIKDDSFIVQTLEGGRYYESTNGSKVKLVENLQKQSTVLELPVCEIVVARHPTDIEGIVEDIPYNYHASITQSAQYVYSLLGCGFDLIEYSASSNVIYMELADIENIIRLVIYEDYLKVYEAKI